MIYDRFKDPLHIEWAKAVKQRDNFKCQICGISKVYLHSHHLESWDHCIDKRFDINNGITLCIYHHETYHLIFGAGNNTKEQFEEYIRFCKLFITIIKKDKE